MKTYKLADGIPYGHKDIDIVFGAIDQFRLDIAVKRANLNPNRDLFIFLNPDAPYAHGDGLGKIAILYSALPEIPKNFILPDFLVELINKSK